MAAPDITAIIKDMVSAAVEEKMGQLGSIADSMVRLHGEYITPKRAAELMNVSVGTVHRMCEDGRLTATKTGSPLILVRSMARMVDDAGDPIKPPSKPKQHLRYRVSP